MKRALIIGINNYSQSVYGKGADLRFCVSDSQKIISTIKTYEEGTWLKNDDATMSEITAQWIRLSEISEPGDNILIYQSSHGTSYINGSDRVCGVCCYDGVIWDNETFDVLKKFKKGVVVTMIFDTCHSESNHRFVKSGGIRCKFIEHPYKSKVPSPTMADKKAIVCSYRHLAACEADRYAYEKEPSGGVFTEALVSSLNSRPELTMAKLRNTIYGKTRIFQKPILDYNILVRPNKFVF